MLQAIGISKKYHKDFVLKNIDLELNSEDRLGIIGLHGSGKTLLMKLLAGMEIPSSGMILLNGKKLGRRKVAYIPQIPLFDPILRARDVMKYVTDKEYLDIVNIDREKKVKFMSLGERKRLALALSLPYSPEYLLLDDITMDQESKELFLDFIKKFRGGVAISHHNMRDVWHVIDSIAILLKGTISYKGNKEGIKFKIIKIRTLNDLSILDKYFVINEGEYVEIWEGLNDSTIEEKLNSLNVSYEVNEVSPDEVFLRFYARN